MPQQYIPQVEFADIKNLKPEDVDRLKTRGCVVIKNVVDDEEAISWKQDLETFVKANPDVEGITRFVSTHVLSLICLDS